MQKLLRKQKKKGEKFEDLDTKKTKFWQEFTAFPLRQEYQKIVENSNEASPEAKNALVSRCVFAMKKIFEHGNIGQELVPARNAQLCSELEWKEFLRAKGELETECKDIETAAEKLRPGFGKQIFQMAQQIALQEQRKHMMEQEAKMKKEAQEAKMKTEAQEKGAKKSSPVDKATKSPKSDTKSKKAE